MPGPKVAGAKLLPAWCYFVLVTTGVIAGTWKDVERAEFPLPPSSCRGSVAVAMNLLSSPAHMLENTGSTARDFCMLERNILAHLRLALLLSLLSSSVLLHARLVPEANDGSGSSQGGSKAGIPLAGVQVAAALAAIAAGAWEYHSGYQDMRNMRAFLAATKPHLAIMTVVAGVVFTTCIILLVDKDH